MSMYSEFRAFIARGNVVDLAVGVVIGAAFGKIVTSLVEQVVMPPIGMALGAVDFSQLKLVLQPADEAAKTAEVAILYGAFINTIIQFLIIAFVVFLMVKAINSVKRAEAEGPVEPPAPSTSEALLAEIRDLLAKPAAVAAAPKVAAPKPTAQPAAAKPASKAAAPKPAAKAAGKPAPMAAAPKPAAPKAAKLAAKKPATKKPK